MTLSNELITGSEFVYTCVLDGVLLYLCLVCTLYPSGGFAFKGYPITCLLAKGYPITCSLAKGYSITCSLAKG